MSMSLLRSLEKRNAIYKTSLRAIPNEKCRNIAEVPGDRSKAIELEVVECHGRRGNVTLKLKYTKKATTTKYLQGTPSGRKGRGDMLARTYLGAARCEPSNVASTVIMHRYRI